MATVTIVHGHKAFTGRLIKADEDTGIVEAIVATYDVDSIGDEIVPGAFAESIAEKKANPQADGGLMPWVWSHQANDPNAFLGSVMELEERENVGLYVKAQHDMDDPESAKAFRLIKSGRVRQYSFAYEAEWREKEGAPGITELTKISIFEAGPTLVGVNQNTHTISAKASRKAEGDDPERGVELSFVGDWSDDEKQAVRDDLQKLIDAAEKGESEGDHDEEPKADEPADSPNDTEKARRLLIKAGRVLSSKNESAIRDAVKTLQGVLDSLPDPDEDDPAKSHRSAGGKGKGKTPDDPTPTVDPSLEELALEIDLALS